MIFEQKWTGLRLGKNGEREEFAATVPGNIQLDYANYANFEDISYADNCRQFDKLENDNWEYITKLSYEKNDGERVWFVSGGIDYKYDILLNGNNIFSYEGMYKPVRIELTEMLTGDDELRVHIYPHPKRKGSPVGTRDEADQSCKPPVCYGWDWNPRLLISGIWQDTYIETGDATLIRSCEVRAALSDDLSEGTVEVSYDCDTPCVLKLYDADGNVVYEGSEPSFTVKEPQLWWCNGQGSPYLYRWTLSNSGDEKSGKIGFRKLRLLRNTGADIVPFFPKGRYPAPITIELNGRRILAKGSNWVNPELFWGIITKERYDELLILAKDANLNFLRMWGGACAAKDSFYELCDEYGIMVWQEFMLACNNYVASKHYMSVLESEAAALILRLRAHPSIAFWCGGNELFNNWSGMDEQSHALRLLNKLCYELDYERPFLSTAPLDGMAHGGYKFYSESQGGDVFNEFIRSKNTAYTEFGVPSSASLELLKKIIPEDEMFPVSDTKSWNIHHATNTKGGGNWLCLDVVERYFGAPKSIEDIVEKTNWLQSSGYQAAFEEIRKQWPYCSMMSNWCYDEPWITAANNSIVSYPAIPKPAYYSVKNALRPTLFSARIPKFDWKAGERFDAGIWLLNDRPERVCGSVEVVLKVGETEFSLLKWDNAKAEANANFEGASVCCVLPDVETDHITLVLKAENDEMSNEYKLPYKPKKKRSTVRMLNE